MRTTLNIKDSILIILNDLSLKSGLSLAELIYYFLDKAGDQRHNLIQFGSLIKYQEKNFDEQWNTIHITYSEGFYEFGLDLRKLFKLSLSHILALAVLKYKHLVLNGTNVKKVDNYPQNFYIFNKYELKGTVYFIHNWWKPKKNT